MKVLSTVALCFVVSATALSQQAPASESTSATSPTQATAPKPAVTPAAAPAATQAGTPAAQPPAAAAPKEKPPEHPCTEAQVREYLTKTGGDKAAHVIMMTMARTSRASAPPYFPATFWTDMMDAFDKADLIPTFLPVYQQHISEEEMASVLAFYKTPAGKHFLEVQPVMASEAQRLLSQQGREVGHDVYLKYKDQIEAGKRQFDAQQGTTNGGTPPPTRKPARVPGATVPKKATSDPATATPAATTSAPTTPAAAPPQ